MSHQKGESILKLRQKISRQIAKLEAIDKMALKIIDQTEVDDESVQEEISAAVGHMDKALELIEKYLREAE